LPGGFRKTGRNRNSNLGIQMTEGLLLCDDLIFASKVTATAAAHGLTVRVCKTPTALLAAAAEVLPAGVILDLNAPGMDFNAVVTGLTRDGIRPRLTGFGSHVDTATLQAAKTAGCDNVMPRSRFVKELEEKLPEWLEQPGVD
jgi:DNA-binding NarL/FixJ family response regulator